MYDFDLCDHCLAMYQALRTDPQCTPRLNIVPFCSPTWGDEHPLNWSVECCDACVQTIVRLVHARRHLWRHGAVPEDQRQLWTEALRVIPDWPGFGRRTLAPEQLQLLDDCIAEREELRQFTGRAVTQRTLS